MYSSIFYLKQIEIKLIIARQIYKPFVLSQSTMDFLCIHSILHAVKFLFLFSAIHLRKDLLSALKNDDKNY